LRALISPGARHPRQDGQANPARIAVRAVRQNWKTMAIMPPRLFRPTTSGLRQRPPAQPSRARCGSRSQSSSPCFGRPDLVLQNEPIMVDVSDCCEVSSALRTTWSRTRSEACPRRVQATTHHAGCHRMPDRSRLDRHLASHGRPWLAGENEAIFIDVSDCCRTSSTVAERWSRTRSEACSKRARSVSRQFPTRRIATQDPTGHAWTGGSHWTAAPGSVEKTKPFFTI
jgi:hypothetical protein